MNLRRARRGGDRASALWAPPRRLGPRRARGDPAGGRRLARARRPREVSLRFDEPVEATLRRRARLRPARASRCGPASSTTTSPRRSASRCRRSSTTASTPPPTASSAPTRTRSRAASRSPSASAGGAPALGVAELVDRRGRRAGHRRRARASPGSRTYVATALLIGGVAFLVFALAPALAARRRRRRALAPRGRCGFAAPPAAAADRRVGARRSSPALAGDRPPGRDRARRLVLGGPAPGGDRRRARDALRHRLGPAAARPRSARRVLLFASRIGLRARTRPAQLGRRRLGPCRRCPRRPAALALGLGLGFLALAPALAGHPGVTDPRGLALASSFVHVLAFSLGSAAWRRLSTRSRPRPERCEPGERTRLLAATLGRFSTVALGRRRGAARDRRGPVGPPARRAVGPGRFRLRTRDPGQGGAARAPDRSRRPQPRVPCAGSRMRLASGETPGATRDRAAADDRAPSSC